MSALTDAESAGSDFLTQDFGMFSGQRLLTGSSPEAERRDQ